MISYQSIVNTMKYDKLALIDFYSGRDTIIIQKHLEELSSVTDLSGFILD